MGEALTAAPDDARGRLLLAVLDRREGDWAKAAAGLRTLLAAPIPAADVRGDAWYELGRVLDHEGDYDGAMDAFVHAKAARRGRVTDELKQSRRGRNTSISGCSTASPPNISSGGTSKGRWALRSA